MTMNDTAIANARANGEGIAYKPLDACHVADVAALEAAVMGTDAWNETLVADELGRADRVWWAAYAADPKMPLSAEAPLVGYAGGWVVDGDLQILKVGVDPAWRRHGIARVLLARVADDARNLGGAHEFAGSTCRKRRGPSAVCGPRLRGTGPPPAATTPTARTPSSCGGPCPLSRWRRFRTARASRTNPAGRRLRRLGREDGAG